MVTDLPIAVVLQPMKKPTLSFVVFNVMARGSFRYVQKGPSLICSSHAPIYVFIG